MSGRRNVGGLVGGNGDSIENCYVRGSVTGDTAVGGLVGSSLGASVLLSYWDGEATGQSLGLGSSRVGDSVFVAFGRTTAQMKAQATYVGW